VQFKDATLEEVFDEICRLAKLRWNVGSNGIYFAPLSPSKGVKEQELPPAYKRQFLTKLRNTRLPKIAFDKSTVREAIAFLVARIRGTDADFGVSLELGSEEGPIPTANPKSKSSGIPGFDTAISQPPQRTITWHVTNPTVEEIVNEICRQGGLKWKLGMHGIEITPVSSARRTQD
jgi:hypothetical protein